MTWVAAAMASAAATAAGVKYIKGRRDAKKDAKNRPTYEIPEEVKQNLSQANLDALQGLPEEQKQQFLSNIQRGSASSLQNLSSRKAGLSGVAAINQQQNDAYGNLMSADAQARMQNKQNLSAARLGMADYRDQAFQINKSNPYYEKIAQRRGNDQELFQGLSNSMGTFAGGAGGMGGGKKTTQTEPQNNNQMSTQYWGNQQMNSGGMYNYNPYSNSGAMSTDNAYSSSGFGNNVG